MFGGSWAGKMKKFSSLIQEMTVYPLMGPDIAETKVEAAAMQF